MVRKSVKRFAEEIMLDNNAKRDDVALYAAVLSPSSSL